MSVNFIDTFEADDALNELLATYEIGIGDFQNLFTEVLTLIAIYALKGENEKLYKAVEIIEKEFQLL